MRRLLASACLPMALASAACGSSATKTVTVTTTGATAASTATTAPSTTAASTASPTTTIISSSTTSTTTPTPATSVLHVPAFKSPSGNIGCMIVAGIARCDIKRRSWSPPARPASCPPEVDYGQGMEVGGSGAGTLVCAGDTTLDPTAPSLAYGSETVIGRFQCSSRRSGLTCTEVETGHGFFISIQSYRTF